MKRRTAKTRPLAVQTLETRRVLAASLGWDGAGLGDATLTYNIANSPASLSQSEVNAAVVTALDAWSAVADITFVPTSQSGLRDSLDISFERIDGPGGTLAQAYLPDDVNPARIAGDIEFDLSETWETGNSLGRAAFDLVWVAAHEIGHALGLDHIDVAGSVLAPYVSPNVQFTSLAQVDVAAIGRLYAAADATEASVDEDDESTVDETPTDITTDTPADDQTPNERRFRRWYWRGWGRFRGRLEADVPEHHNIYNATDVNGDDNTTAVDALMIINQLSRSVSGAEGESIDGMCDTNGDGAISASDALFVINTISQTGTQAAEQVDDAGVIDAADPSEEDADEGASTDDVTIVTDTEDPNDSLEETDPDESADEDGDVDDTDDSGDDSGTLENGDQVDDSDADDSEDGETVDDDSDSGDDDDEHCHDGHSRGHHGQRGFLGHDGESLLSRFDANGDDNLTVDEVPTFIWEKLVDQNVDTDGDELVTLEELDAAIAAARAEKFAELDTSGDGLLQQQEVSPRRWERIVDADSDGDGAVSMDELDTWVQQRQMEKEQDRQQDNVDRVFAQFARPRNLRFRPRF